MAYDAAGGVTNDGRSAMRYNAEDLVARSWPLADAARVTDYDYDGDNRRVGVTTAGTRTTYVFDAMGQLAAEYGGTVAMGGTSWVHGDALGSTRLVTGVDGAVRRRVDYWPFGEEMLGGQTGYRSAGLGYAADGEPRVKFTGKERDAETGLDYFGARYLSGVQGRFTSADAPFADQHVERPQSWNLYSYTRDSPLRFVDDDGRGVKEGGQNWVNHTGFAFVRTVLEPDKVAQDLASGAQKLWDNRGEIAGQVAQAAKDFWDASPDDKATAATEVALDVLAAGALTRVIRGGVALTELSIGALSESGPVATEAVAGTTARFVPEAYWKKEAPTQVAPGVRRVDDMKPSSRSRGESYRRTTYYDQYGRSVGQTHRTAHGEPTVHPNPHHHVRNPKTGQTSGPKPGQHPEEPK